MGHTDIKCAIRGLGYGFCQNMGHGYQVCYYRLYGDYELQLVGDLVLYNIVAKLAVVKLKVKVEEKDMSSFVDKKMI